MNVRLWAFFSFDFVARSAKAFYSMKYNADDVCTVVADPSLPWTYHGPRRTGAGDMASKSNGTTRLKRRLNAVLFLDHICDNCSNCVL
jgi:hypothetical protein